MTSPGSLQKLLIELSETSTVSFAGITKAHGRCEARILIGGDMEVNLGDGRWVSRRPLEGINSWHKAWDNEWINLLIEDAGTAVPIDDWEDLDSLPIVH